MLSYVNIIKQSKSIKFMRLVGDCPKKPPPLEKDQPLMRSPLLASAVTLALLASSARADWQVNSEFKLHLPESTFDQLIQDFWQTLQGSQTVAVGNIPVNLGDTQLAINGINVSVDYSFPIPQRVDNTHREWKLMSNTVGAKVTVDQLVITQQKVINVGGINIGTTITATCNNIALALPAGSATVQATVRAEVAQNQIQLSMPTYGATWPDNAWQVTGLDCPELGNVGGQVTQQIQSYLSSFQNVDAAVGAALNRQFTAWSQKASVLLLSQQNLPTGVDYLNASFEPATAAENNGNGLIIGGTLRFVYPFVAQGQHFEQSFALPADAQITPNANPQLLIPFATPRAVMMGHYFAGKLEYTLRSTEIGGFTSFMNSYFQKLFVWPDLLSFSNNTLFLFNVQPMGPPSFTNEAASGTNGIKGNLSQPISMRMYAPIKGVYTPYVEFRTTLSGPAIFTLGTNGKVTLKMTPSDQAMTYAFADAYVKKYNPNTGISVSKLQSAAHDAMASEGVSLTIPNFAVGSNLTLLPTDWTLQKGSVLRLGFTTTSTAAAAVATSASASSSTKKK